MSYGYSCYWYEGWTIFDWQEFLEDHQEPNDEEDLPDEED